MSDVSYTISPQVKLELERIEGARKEILTLLLSREKEKQARWDANIERTSFASRLTDEKLKKMDVEKIVNPFARPRALSETEGYFKAYLWIDNKWFLNDKALVFSDIKKLLVLSGFSGAINNEQITKAVEFVQVTPEHPIVQAAIIFCFLYNLIEAKDSIKTLIMLSNIFIYKGGYDFRGMLILEEFFAEDLVHLKKLLEESYSKNNMAGFIEYFVQATSIQAERAVNKLKSYRTMTTNLFLLTERQKEIMTLFDKPGAKITNRKVQKEFGISQITASRDLAKINALGYIYKNGRGRSVYYTKF